MESELNLSFKRCLTQRKKTFYFANSSAYEIECMQTNTHFENINPQRKSFMIRLFIHVYYSFMAHVKHYVLLFMI